MIRLLKNPEKTLTRLSKYHAILEKCKETRRKSSLQEEAAESQGGISLISYRCLGCEIRPPSLHSLSEVEDLFADSAVQDKQSRESSSVTTIVAISHWTVRQENVDLRWDRTPCRPCPPHVNVVTRD